MHDQRGRFSVAFGSLIQVGRRIVVRALTPSAYIVAAERGLEKVVHGDSTRPPFRQAERYNRSARRADEGERADRYGGLALHLEGYVAHPAPPQAAPEH